MTAAPTFIFNAAAMLSTPFNSGSRGYEGVFTPLKPGQSADSLKIPEAKPYCYGMGGNSSSQSLQVPNQNPSPLAPAQAAPPKTFADKLASLNLPGLVEGLGLQNQLTRPSVRAAATPMAGSMTEEQLVGAECIAAYHREQEENKRKNSDLIANLERAGILNSARLIEEAD